MLYLVTKCKINGFRLHMLLPEDSVELPGLRLDVGLSKIRDGSKKKMKERPM